MFRSILYLLLLSPLLAFALTQANTVQVPKQLTATEKKSFQSIGSATFSVLFWDIYQAKLMTSSGKYPVSESTTQLIFEINYFADISSDDLVKRTQEQWQHIGLAADQYQPYLSQLKQLWPDIQDGDRLSLFMTNLQSHFYFNQRYIGTLASPQFGQQFIDIWLSPLTSQPDLRSQLLGEKNDK